MNRRWFLIVVLAPLAALAPAMLIPQRAFAVSVIYAIAFAAGAISEAVSKGGRLDRD